MHGTPHGIVQLALRDLRAEVGDELVLIADLCVDEYTDHGHCGIVTPDGEVDNDATLAALRAGGRRPGRRRRRHHRAERDDGRPGRGHPRRPRRRRPRADGDPRLRRQVRLRALRPVPRRRRRVDRRRRRPQGLPAGSAQRARGARGDPRRRRRGRRHRHGEAGPRLPRRDRRGPRRGRPARSPPTTCPASTR